MVKYIYITITNDISIQSSMHVSYFTNESREAKSESENKVLLPVKPLPRFRNRKKESESEDQVTLPVKPLQVRIRNWE